MLLTQCTGRARLLGSLRLCVLGVGSYHDDVGATVATRILSRQAGGVAGKRNNKYRGQFKFVDKLYIVATGGKGGDGCVSLEGESPTRKRPSGGSGGSGGNVYAVADSALETLDSQLHHFNGQHGAPGGGSGKKGRTGKDAFIRVPCGTLVSEVVKEETYHDFHSWALADGIECGGGKAVGERDEEGEEGFDFDEEENEHQGGVHDTERGGQYIADLEKDGDQILLASGGKPGLGNLHVASRRVGTKIPGQLGESRHYHLELRTIADVGLVGYPNAGKSTLLGCITAAKPKVAMYPFTTLSPVVGQVEYSDTIRIRVADIPGLIDGAHQNRGLGHEFLRHVARTRVLMFVVDAAGSEGRDPVEDFMSLKEELRLYDDQLSQKPAFVVANKTDLPEAGEHLERLRRAAGPWRLVPVSALEARGLVDVVVAMREVLEEGRREQDVELAATLEPEDGGVCREEDKNGADKASAPGQPAAARWLREGG